MQCPCLGGGGGGGRRRHWRRRRRRSARLLGAGGGTCGRGGHLFAGGDHLEELGGAEGAQRIAKDHKQADKQTGGGGRSAEKRREAAKGPPDELTDHLKANQVGRLVNLLIEEEQPKQQVAQADSCNSAGKKFHRQNSWSLAAGKAKKSRPKQSRAKQSKAKREY